MSDAGSVKVLAKHVVTGDEFDGVRVEKFLLNAVLGPLLEKLPLVRMVLRSSIRDVVTD